MSLLLMSRIKLSRNYIKKVLEYVLVIVLTFAGVFYMNRPQLGLNEEDALAGVDSTFKYEKNNEFRKDLTRAVKISFANYFEKCPTSDEINPETGDCINTTELSLSLLESVETLYLLGLKKLYRKAYHQIKTHFTCDDLGVTNKRILWTRGIGSLIGSYSLTGDKMFLEKAVKCSNELLKFHRNNDPFINPKKMKTAKRTMESSVELSDVTVGLPELYALYINTKDETYLTSIKNKVQSLRKLLPQYSTLINSKTYENTTNEFVLDHRTVDYFGDLALLVNISDKKLFKTAVNNFEKVVELDPESFDQYEMLNVESLLNKKFRNSEDLFDNGQMMYAPPFMAFSPGWPYQMIPFDFDGTFLRVFYNRGLKEEIQTIVGASLESCKENYGYTGFIKSTKKVLHSIHRQYPSFFGEWTKLAALTTVTSPQLKKVVLNSRGHILFVPK